MATGLGPSVGDGNPHVVESARLRGALCSGNFSCDEEDGGAITVACHSCYGSPPARLERLTPECAFVLAPVRGRTA